MCVYTYIYIYIYISLQYYAFWTPTCLSAPTVAIVIITTVSGSDAGVREKYTPHARINCNIYIYIYIYI